MNQEAIVERVISGGQTGIDQLALMVAKSMGVQTGGTAPKGFLTENGPEPGLGTLFGLTQHQNDKYPPRTEQNVKDSDATIVFGDMESAGSRLTVSLCVKHKKPCLENPTNILNIIHWLDEHQVKVLNVAGNRASKLTKRQYRQYHTLMYMILHHRS